MLSYMCLAIRLEPYTPRDNCLAPRDRASVIPPQLISAEELMRRLNLTPGPIIGQLLDQIAEAQAEGTVHSKEEALWYAEEKLL